MIVEVLLYQLIINVLKTSYFSQTLLALISCSLCLIWILICWKCECSLWLCLLWSFCPTPLSINRAPTCLCLEREKRAACSLHLCFIKSSARGGSKTLSGCVTVPLTSARYFHSVGLLCGIKNQRTKCRAKDLCKSCFIASFLIIFDTEEDVLKFSFFFFFFSSDLSISRIARLAELCWGVLCMESCNPVRHTVESGLYGDWFLYLTPQNVGGV